MLLCCRKLDLFKKYFNIYGLFNLAFPMLINTMLIYNLLETGFDAMSVCVSITFFSQIFLAAFFAQILTGQVGG